MTQTHLPQHWRYRLLHVLDCPANIENLRFLQAWAQAERGTAERNPLNTTVKMPWGSDPYNDSGVQNYSDPVIGICATAITLDGANFRVIVEGMFRGTFTAEELVERYRPQITEWGTNPDTILAVLKSM